MSAVRSTSGWGHLKMGNRPPAIPVERFFASLCFGQHSRLAEMPIDLGSHAD
jgi:hypothetical protein